MVGSTPARDWAVRTNSTPSGGLLHHLQEGVGRFAVHPLGMVQQHRPALGRQLVLKISLRMAVTWPTRYRRRCPSLPPRWPPGPPRFPPAAGPVAGFGHRFAAFSPQQGFRRRPARRVEIIRRHAPGCKACAQALFPDQKQAVAQPPATLDRVFLLFQGLVARKPVQHHPSRLLFQHPFSIGPGLISGSSFSTAVGDTRPGDWTRAAAQRTAQSPPWTADSSACPSSRPTKSSAPRWRRQKSPDT